MTAREATCRRKRRLRAEALARAAREETCGGPLVDIAAPVIGGGDDEHLLRVRAELESRSRRIQYEAFLLALAFAERCLLVRAEREEMLLDLVRLWKRVGAARAIPTHSTDPAMPTATIPAL